MSASPSDRIQKSITLRAPRSRVWRALAEPAEFGAWFGVRFDAGTVFARGRPIHGVIVPTQADATVAGHQKPYEGMPFDIVVDRVEPERLFSFRWHPFAIEKGIDYSAEPTTLVVFELENVTVNETRVTVTESGFDRIPLERRAKAFTANEQGWAMVVTLLEKHLA